MNRGSERAFRSLGVTSTASMRPRFMNRGSGSDGDMDEAGDRASMRPRFMNRGSCDPELPAEPGCAGFNEAPIHESGKLLHLQRLHSLQGYASMRPRFMNRGSARTALPI